MEEGPKIPWRMADLVETLLANNADNLRRQLEDCLCKLVGLCLPLTERVVVHHLESLLHAHSLLPST